MNAATARRSSIAVIASLRSRRWRDLGMRSLKRFMKHWSRQRASPASGCKTVPEPRWCHNDVLIKSIGRRSAAPTCISTTGTPGRRRRYPCPWPSGTSYSRRDRRDGSECAASRPAIGVGRRHITAATAVIAVPDAVICAATHWGGRESPGAFPSTDHTRRHVFKLPPAIDDETPRSRPVRQCHPHRPAFTWWRGRAHHRRVAQSASWPVANLRTAAVPRSGGRLQCGPVENDLAGLARVMIFETFDVVVHAQAMVMTGRTFRPLCSMLDILYQVSNISRP